MKATHRKKTLLHQTVMPRMADLFYRFTGNMGLAGLGEQLCFSPYGFPAETLTKRSLAKQSWSLTHDLDSYVTQECYCVNTAEAWHCFHAWS